MTNKEALEELEEIRKILIQAQAFNSVPDTILALQRLVLVYITDLKGDTE